MRNKYIEKLLQDIDCKSDILDGERNGFLLSLMVVSSYAIQADNKIMHSEMEYIREFLSLTFGEEKKDKCVNLLMSLFEESKKYSYSQWTEKIEKCTRGIAIYTSIEQRLLLVTYIVKLIQADNAVDIKEIESVKNIATWLNVETMIVGQIEELNNELIETWKD